MSASGREDGILVGESISRMQNTDAGRGRP